MTESTGAQSTGTQFTDEERQTIRTAAFGAMFLVSNADPGMFAAVKESFAGSKVLAGTSPALRDLLKSGGLPQLPKGSPEEVEAAVLAALRSASGILQEKAPGELDGFRTAVVDACEQVAAASGGVKDGERTAIEKVRAALPAT